MLQEAEGVGMCMHASHQIATFSYAHVIEMHTTHCWLMLANSLFVPRVHLTTKMCFQKTFSHSSLLKCGRCSTVLDCSPSLPQRTAIIKFATPAYTQEWDSPCHLFWWIAKSSELCFLCLSTHFLFIAQLCNALLTSLTSVNGVEKMLTFVDLYYYDLGFLWGMYSSTCLHYSTVLKF